jgi:protein-disulfide isomerase
MTSGLASTGDKRLIYLASVFAFVGLFAAGVLSAGHLLDLPLPCGKGRGCAIVAGHPSSRLGNVPLAVIGFAGYVVALALIARANESALARKALALGVAMGAGVSGFLIYYAHAVIHATCAWCLGSAGAMLGLFVCSLLMWRRPPAAPVSAKFFWTLAFLTMAGIGLQAGLMQRAANRPPVAAARLAKESVATLVDPPKAVGPTNAAITIVVFADFWCPACRKAQGALDKFQAANAEKVRVAFRHLPLFQIRGHEFSGTAAALSEIAAEHGKFWEFARAMHAQRRQLKSEEYLEVVKSLGIEPAPIEARLKDENDPAVRRAVADVALAERLGVTATPTFIVLAGSYAPVSANTRTLEKLLNSPEALRLLAK